MFCPGCGSQLQAGLNYCSRCGRRVEEGRGANSSFVPTPPVVAAITAGAGFFCFMFVIRALSKAGMPPNQFIPIAFVYFTALFGICFMILRHGAGGLVKSAESVDDPSARRVDASYLGPANTAQLRAPSDSPASVTEHTTRTLDGIPVDRH